MKRKKESKKAGLPCSAHEIIFLSVDSPVYATIFAHQNDGNTVLDAPTNGSEKSFFLKLLVYRNRDYWALRFLVSDAR